MLDTSRRREQDYGRSSKNIGPSFYLIFNLSFSVYKRLNSLRTVKVLSWEQKRITIVSLSLTR